MNLRRKYRNMSMSRTEDFTCADCRSEYKVVLVPTDEPVSQTRVECLVCGSNLATPPDEIAKYIMVRRRHGRAASRAR